MEGSMMAAALLIRENGVIGKCQKKAGRKGGTVIQRADLMSFLLNKNIDKSTKRQLSMAYDMILDLEKENKIYITHVNVSDDSDEKVLALIKSEI